MKVHVAAIALIALSACKGEVNEQPPKEQEIGLPEVWGPAALEDMDPDPDVVEVHMTASRTHVPWFDGKDTMVWAYNDQLPGPLIQARVGQTLRVVFTNDLEEEPTTIHWHGLRIDNEMDGVPAVQTPIEPGETFTYEFVLPDAGSYWYHPHYRSNEQVERGLYGALVVHEEEPPAYDKERYFVLDDVLVGTDNQLESPGVIAGMEAMHGRHGNVLLANGQPELLTDEVAHGTRERWRIVNTANARTMYFSVTGADWRVIAMDGNLISETFKGGERQLLPVGRRFDVEVVPTDEAETVGLQIELPGYEGYDQYPMFEAELTGEEPAPGFLSLNVPELEPLEPPTQDVTLDFDAENSGMTFNWVINGLPYGEGEPIQVQGDQPTRITIHETSGAEHPFHLHGQFFRIVDRDEGRKYPGLLDTVLLRPFEEVTLQTDFSNPGKWLAHCHILEHAELGMMTEIHVNP